jgi:hypothetical protein
VIALFGEPFSPAAVSRESAWIDLAPEVLITVVMIIMIERVARRYVDPADRLPARPAP